MAKFKHLIPVTQWLIKKHFEKKCNSNHFFGPAEHKTTPTKFILETEDNKYILFLPYPSFDYLNKKKAYHEAAIQDDTIFKCVFIIPLALNDVEMTNMLKIFKGKKQVEIWDSILIKNRFEKYFGFRDTDLEDDELDLERALELIDKYNLKNSNKPESPQVYTQYGSSLRDLSNRFSFEISTQILKEAKNQNTDDLFSTDDYSLSKESIVLAGDIKNFTSLMDKATKKRNPSNFGKHLKKWYEMVAETILSYNGFVDKFMGDGFLAFFGYPFMDNKEKILTDVYHCSCELIKKTEEILLTQYIERIFPEFSESNTGSLRLGISSGELYTLPTSTLCQSSYQGFYILGNPIVEATRIEALVEPKMIGIDLETFEEFKQVIPRIEKGGNRKIEKIKKQKISFFQIEP